MKSSTGAAAAALAALLLTGCAVTKTADIVADKEGYLARNFTAGALPAAIQSMLAEADTQPPAFQRMELVYAPRYARDNSAIAIQLKETLLNVGPGLVARLDENFQNDIPTAEIFQLTYRNIEPLRTQFIRLNEEVVARPMTTQSFEHFDPVRPDTVSGELVYDYVDGGERMHDRCRFGDSHPATQINAAFTGEARVLECQSHNNEGNRIASYQMAYLVDYGVAIETRRDGASGPLYWHLQEVKIN
jgi:hypothetical protein